MTLEIGTALREGFERTASRNGLLLIGVFLAFGLANAVVGQSFSEATFRLVERTEPIGPAPDPSMAERGDLPFALGLPVALAAALSVVAFVVEEGLRVVSIRVFASEHTETLPPEGLTRRVATVTILSAVASVVVAVLTAVGLVFLVVPGLYVALSFFFVRQAIAIEDSGLVDALRDSWALTGGNRWELLGLAVVVAVVNLLAGLPGIVLGFASPLVNALFSVVVGAVTTVFGIAVATRAYTQLTDEDDAGLSDSDEWDDPAGL